METQKIQIVICLGSSCFSRGNRETLEVIKQYIKDNNLGDKVFFRGRLCSESCNKGPIVWIDETKYEAVTPHNIVSILNQVFKPRS
ncbi:MAG: (2Fe-2S) ferredoxin domain-containing protein [Bacteroidales bacterium]|nr:(2Fe-2S) ferredoxin domain-containing protein [Bacteroidales bacterium]HPD95665.1 (2Fe-2S) ferredoxin domain-containing protein [Tenuifilaceae bacterium]HRX31851.1 (2Fe-2S) ferredoxin domain-containing protein [Tenuifilaceae bacterium]